MPIDAQQVQALAQANLGRTVTAVDAAGVAAMLEGLRSGLAALPHRRELAPAIGTTPLPVEER